MFHTWIHPKVRPRILLLFLDWQHIKVHLHFIFHALKCISYRHPQCIHTCVCAPRTSLYARCKKALNVTTQLKQPGSARILSGFRKHGGVPYFPFMLNMLPCMKTPPSFHFYNVYTNWDLHSVTNALSCQQIYGSKHCLLSHFCLSFLSLYKKQPTVELNVVSGRLFYLWMGHHR